MTTVLLRRIASAQSSPRWRLTAGSFRFASSSASEAGSEETNSGSDSLFKVAGQSVVVTGGAQGIGKVLASGFASRGCRVFVLDLDRSKAEEAAADIAAAHPECLGAQGFSCDVREVGQVKVAAAAVAESLRSSGGSLDVLINCAGVTRRLPAEDFSMEDFDKIIDTNTRGTWSVTMQFGTMMLQGGRGGCIINIDSFVTSSLLKHVLPYSMSKASVQALTKGLALEWGPKGVRVNGIAPGLVLTPISEALWSQAHMQRWAMDQTPLGRMASTDDMVGTAVFLASPAARFISGQTIRVDGGLSSGMHWPIDGSPTPSVSSCTSRPAASPSFGAGPTRGFSSVRGFVSARAFSSSEPVAASSELNHYTGAGFAANPFEGDGVQVNIKAGAVSSAKVEVLNGRCDSELSDPSCGSLAQRGFTVQRQVSSVRHFQDEAEVREKYYPELLEMAKHLTGADRVRVVSHVTRQVGEKPDVPRGAAVRGGAFLVHGDFCDALKGQFQDMLKQGKPNAVGEGGLELSEEEFSAGRLVVLNFWRPTSREPMSRAPLAVCDASSMRSQDLHIYVHDPQPPPKNYSLPLPNQLTVAEHRPEHHWYTFPGMTRDECLVFKTYDSAGLQPSNGVGVHSAFEDPVDLEGVRDSIEARVLCFISGPSSEGAGAKWRRGASETEGARPPMENIERIRFYKWLKDSEGWSGAVGLTAKFTIPQEQSAVFLDIMRGNIACTWKEKGMLQYDLVSDYDPAVAAESGQAIFWLLERFKTRGDLLKHVESEHYKRCQERFLKDMGGHPLVQIGLYRIDPVEP